MLTAFALRMYHLAGQSLSWDEGWSIGLSSQPWGEINRITALDVHPPLFYYFFRIWLRLGKAESVMRFLSVVAGILAVPLSYVTARAWLPGSEGDRKVVGFLAAALAAWSPFLIYYSQVARMFSLCVTLSLLATYCLLKSLDRSVLRFRAGFVLSATAAIFTFYYSACVLIAVLLYALFCRPQRWRDLLVLGGSVALLYLPWLTAAVPPMLERVSARTSLGAHGTVADMLRLLGDGLFGLVFAYGAGWVAVIAMLLVLVGGVVLARRSRVAIRPLLLPLLAVVLTLAAVSLGAQAHMFAARYLIVASPFLGLAIAWAIAQAWRCAKWLAALSLLVVAACALPTIVSYVYEKPYEVSDAFHPQDGYLFLQDKAAADDIVFYNVLSLAGHYERYRGGNDPPWSYVLRWDPVIEPLAPALEERVLPAASRYRRLWFVLYKGTVAANFELKEWLDENLFPAYGEWREDTLYLQYLPPAGPLKTTEPAAVFGQSIWLRAAEYSGSAQSDGPITVQLCWSTSDVISASYKVFVHLYTPDGRLVAQHDSVPMNELRPTHSWRPGEIIIDRHGLWVPKGVVEPLRLVVGLYDPESDARLLLADGADHAEVGIVELLPRGA